MRVDPIHGLPGLPARLALTTALVALVTLSACSFAPSYDEGSGRSAPATYSESSSMSLPPHPEASTFIGLNLFKAIEKADSLGLEWRIIQRDGQTMGISSEQLPERLNFIVEKTTVTAVTTG